MSDEAIEIEVKIEHIDPRQPAPYVVRFLDGSEREFWSNPEMTAAEWANVASIMETRVETAPDFKVTVGDA